MLVAVLLAWATAQPPRAPLQEDLALDLARLEELYRITDAVGDAIWPGFDARAVPIAINLDDRRELLIGHPAPPEEYRPLADVTVAGVPVLARDGVSRYGPRGGGWAVDLAGYGCVYVGRKGPELPTERYLTLLLHEAFHVFQDGLRSGAAEGAFAESQGDDPRDAALLALEGRALADALAADGDDARERAHDFVAVRRERRRGLDPAVVRREGEDEFREGTATYAQARVLQLVPLPGPSTLAERDPDFTNFAQASSGAGPELAELLASVPAPVDAVVDFGHAMYRHGMAQGLVLDRVRPDWKRALDFAGATQFALLEREFPADAEDDARRFAATAARHDLPALLAAQERLVRERLDRIRALLEVPGRRYRIHYGELHAGFRWKPEGPVHLVPDSLLAEEDRGAHLTIWEGGIRRFEVGSLVFESQAVPVVWRTTRLEWCDPTSAEPTLAFAGEDQDGVLRDVRLETPGFLLTVARARVTRGDAAWDVVALPGE